ncbi:adenylate/guanylate cyclase domain-containing protein [Stappia albiluteola]|nr:adenylate/guanylate cyclase domain-containing protein [Stappia albiluteola]
MKKGPAGNGTLEQQLRLASGLVLIVFVLTHFLNHALGHISLGVMQAGQDLRYAVWHSLPGTVLLYSALFTHVVLALWRTARRGTLHIPKWQAFQLGLGLLIPFFLIRHIMGTRGSEVLYSTYVDYRHELSLLWPGSAIQQSLLLVIVWLHGMIGLHYWLRLHGWYKAVQPTLFALAVAVPLLALTGWIAAAQRLVAEGGTKINATPEQLARLSDYATAGIFLAYGLVGLTVAAYFGLKIWRRFGPMVSIAYIGGRTIKAHKGLTLLEISRLNRIPHMSVCGGRGRCSTCRTLVLAGGETLNEISAAEQGVLKRIHAGPGVRLACQIRPTSDLVVRPLIPSAKPLPPSAIHDRYRWGVERPIGVMFIDMRGFTRLTEGRLPFDVVFILNRYIDGMVRTIRHNGGMVDKVMGDGVMALFGVEVEFQAGLRQALATIVALSEEIDTINRDLANHLDAPLRIGIGLHGGQSILGRIGLDGRSGVESGLTALGDVVNVASRLEAATKEEGAFALVSHDVLATAGMEPTDIGTTRELFVRGRSAPLEVAAISDVTALAEALVAERDSAGIESAA